MPETAKPAFQHVAVVFAGILSICAGIGYYLEQQATSAVVDPTFNPAPAAVHELIRANSKVYADELCDLVSIPSISSLPEHAADVRRAATWLEARLTRAGFPKVAVYETAKHPVVYAEYSAGAELPTVLVYGHYDVQPVDPLDLWATQPFDCRVEGGVFKGRGVSDDKGSGILPALQGIEAVLTATGALPVNVKLLFEGMEEIGSPGLRDWMRKNLKMLQADAIISADGNQVGERQPGLLTGLRGMAAMEFSVTTAKTDVHSGSFGGAIPNPLHCTAALVATLHGPGGEVRIEGWYDDVRLTTDEDRADLAAFQKVSSDAELLRSVGVRSSLTPANVSVYEAIWNHPTVEVVGMWGGFQDEGIKTVIPKEAHAKLAFRLVPYQDPEKLLKLARSHLERHKPLGCQLSFKTLNPGSRAFLTSKEGLANQAVAKVLRAHMGVEPVWYRMGGSIPAITFFDELAGRTADIAFMAFGLGDQRVHAPNEFMRESMFNLAQHAYADLLFQMAAVHNSTEEDVLVAEATPESSSDDPSNTGKSDEL